MKKKKSLKMITINAKIDCSELDEAMQKAERLHELLKEANSLADELASKDVKITISM